MSNNKPSLMSNDNEGIVSLHQVKKKYERINLIIYLFQMRT